LSDFALRPTPNFRVDEALASSPLDGHFMTADAAVNPLEQKRFSAKNWLKIFIGLLISIGSLWFAVRDLFGAPDAWDKIVTAFREARYASLPVIWLLLFAFYWLKALRWKLLLSSVGHFHPLRDLLGPIMIGFGFNNLLPLRIGELLRCHAFAKQQRLPLTVALSSVILERIMDGMAIVFYLSIGLLFVQGLDPRVQQGAFIFSVVAAAVVVSCLVYVIWTKPFVTFVERVLDKIPFLPALVTRKICTILEEGAQGLASLKAPRLVMLMLVISLVKWGLNGLLALLALWSFGLPHSLSIGMVLMGAIAFGVAIPSSPGYIGVMQLIFMSVMQFFTLDQESVLAASVYYQFSQWIPVTLAGLIYGILFLWRGDLKLTPPA